MLAPASRFALFLAATLLGSAARAGERLTGAGLKVRGGLMNVSAQPGTITQLALVSKSTGTLDLTWTAPGLDGALANATGGFYRIDYSSEAGHLFAPTTHQLELATSVVAGATESYQLTGLSPNSTYYVNIYLTGAERYFAGDSNRLDESTLANAPANPFLGDVGGQLVRAQTSMPGSYQVRGLARTAGFDLDLSGVTNKAITPNGDGRNDQVIFTFENPRDSLITGDIFDVTGARITAMAAAPNTLKWDGKAGGRVVPSGVYVYQIRGEGKNFNGTLVVIR